MPYCVYHQLDFDVTWLNFCLRFHFGWGIQIIEINFILIGFNKKAYKILRLKKKNSLEIKAGTLNDPKLKASLKQNKFPTE